MTEKTVWRVDPVFNTIDQDCPVVYGNIVCRAPSERYEDSLAEWPERARLICAAPDLLAACERVLEWELPQADRPLPIPWDTGVLPLLRAAVAKATGVDAPDEPESDDCPTCEDEVAPLTADLDEPAPALKTWWIRTDDGSLSMTAERVEAYEGALVFRTGGHAVGRVADGRWIAYWEDANG